MKNYVYLLAILVIVMLAAVLSYRYFCGPYSMQENATMMYGRPECPETCRCGPACKCDLPCKC